jgi:hypothetical protein
MMPIAPMSMDANVNIIVLVASFLWSVFRMMIYPCVINTIPAMIVIKYAM